MTMTNSNSETVEISSSDLEIRNNTIAKEIVAEGDKAMTQKMKIVTLAREWAYNLEQMVDRDLVLWPKDTIYGTILENLRKQGISAVGRIHIYEAFSSPEYNKYRRYRKISTSASVKAVEPQIAPPTPSPLVLKKIYDEEKAADDIQVNDALFIIEQNLEHDTVKAHLQKHFVQYEKEQKRSRQQEKDLSKICMEKPEPRESRLSEMLKHLAVLTEIAADRVETYPPKTEEDDIYFKNGVSILIDWMQSIADLKWSRSIYSWIDIDNEKHTQSTHSAMSKSKIESASIKHPEINGMLRKVTREQIDAKDPIILDLAARIIEACPFLIALDIYKDSCQAPWNGGFHLRRHDKLSESAFGNSSLN